jgi:hypothetical protein
MMTTGGELAGAGPHGHGRPGGSLQAVAVEIRVRVRRPNLKVKPEPPVLRLAAPDKASQPTRRDPAQTPSQLRTSSCATPALGWGMLAGGEQSRGRPY